MQYNLSYVHAGIFFKKIRLSKIDVGCIRTDSLGPWSESIYTAQLVTPRRFVLWATPGRRAEWAVAFAYRANVVQRRWF